MNTDFKLSYFKGTNPPIEINVETFYIDQFVHTWHVLADCDQVQIISTYFNTEDGIDNVTIQDTVYSGTQVIDQIVPNSFLVSFKSDKNQTRPRFRLLWQCSDKLLVQQGN